MTSRTIVSLALASFALSSPSLAQPATAPTPNGPDPQSKIVCKYELKTGTRLKERSCKTVKDWDAMREQHMRDAKEMAGPVVNTDSTSPSTPN